ncbi:hypothetical protein NLG97_g7205 [Lecanicillium saksenae]|uniref:Uncharacterized protein n=1 Tax=Lecanicillium saksenae TaxID=468837 RepID=A0ACC1QQG3_9HYPO|nr:hypothetical protein NLG97_g7205 [Lecanicillium saksenae]
MRQPLAEDTRRFSSPFAPTQPPQGQGQDSAPSAPSARRPTSLPVQARSFSQSVRPRDHSVRFRDEPQVTHFLTPQHSEDEESIAGSELTVDSDVSSRRRRKQRLPRKSTTFALAHPAPGLRTKQRRLVQFRPKVLLQLQEVGEKRAVPAYDIVPSSQIAGSFIIPALARRFPRMFRAKPDLGQNDLLLMRSENYNISTPAIAGNNEANEPMGERDVLAVVSVHPHEGIDHAELTFRDGSTWTIETVANGSYQVKKMDGSTFPITGRWVRRTTPTRTNSMESSGVGTTAQTTPDRWTFSILDPAARRHPIQGVLTSTSLEIYDNYNTMSASSSRYPPTKAFGGALNMPQEEQQGGSTAVAEERKTVDVTEENKMLMMASATWISLVHAGWPATANPKMARSVSQCSNALSDYPRRSLSTQTDSRESSGEFKPQDGVTQQRRRSTGFAPPARSLSAASHFMRKQQEQRLHDSSQAGSTDGRNTPDSVDKAIPRKGAMTKLASWLRNCFGGEGGAQKQTL